MNETVIKTFLVLANTLNFTQTAKMLYMTQQAVSKNISKLEDVLGFPLFVRTHHSVTLTRNGQRFYELFTRFSHEYNETLEQARTEQEGDSRTLNVGFQNWLDFGPAPNRVLAKLRKTMPNTYVVVERHSPFVLMDKLVRREMDIVLIYRSFAHDIPGMKSRDVAEVPRVLMVCADNPLATEEATYKTFLKEPYIFDFFEKEKVSEYTERAHNYAEKYGLDPKKIIIVPNRDSAFSAAEQGRGVIVTTMMNRIIGSSLMKCYPMDDTPCEMLTAIWRDDAENAFAEEYVELLTQEYEKGLYPRRGTAR